TRSHSSTAWGDQASGSFLAWVYEPTFHHGIFAEVADFTTVLREPRLTLRSQARLEREERPLDQVVRRERACDDAAQVPGEGPHEAPIGLVRDEEQLLPEVGRVREPADVAERLPREGSGESRAGDDQVGEQERREQSLHGQ